MSQDKLHLTAEIVHVTMATIAFAIGMSAAAIRLRDFRRPGLLARSLFAVMVVVPALAVLVVRALPLQDADAAGLLVVAICVGPVAAFERARSASSDATYALMLGVTLMLASIVVVPLSVIVLAALHGRHLYVGAGPVLRTTIAMELVPLAAGVALGRIAPKLRAAIDGPLSALTNVALVAVVALVLVLLGKHLVSIGPMAWLACALLAVLAVSAGWLLGGRDGGTGLVLAAFTSLRFPMLGIALAGMTAHRERVILVVLAYVLTSAIVFALFVAGQRLVSRGSTQTVPEGAHAEK